MATHNHEPADDAPEYVLVWTAVMIVIYALLGVIYIVV